MMKMNIKWVVFICLSMLLTSCNNTVKEYYESGELRCEKIKEGDHFLTTEFYKKGGIKGKGYLLDTIKDGYWEEWYEDENVKWTGLYNKGKRQYDKVASCEDCSFSFSGNEINSTDTVLFRIKFGNIHPYDLGYVACSGGDIKMIKENTNYDYLLIPLKDTIKFRIKVFDLDNGEIECSKTFLRKSLEHVL